MTGWRGARRSAWALCAAGVTLTFPSVAPAAERHPEGALACNALCEAWMLGQVFPGWGLGDVPALRSTPSEHTGTPDRMDLAGPEPPGAGPTAWRRPGWRLEPETKRRAERLPPWAAPAGWRFERRVAQTGPERAGRGQDRPSLDVDRKPSSAPKAERAHIALDQGAFLVDRPAPLLPPRRPESGLGSGVPLPPTVDRGLDPTTAAMTRPETVDRDRMDDLGALSHAHPVLYAPLDDEKPNLPEVTAALGRPNMPDGVPAALALLPTSNYVPAIGVPAKPATMPEPSDREEPRRVPPAGRTEIAAGRAPATLPVVRVDIPNAATRRDQPPPSPHPPTSSLPGDVSSGASRPWLAGRIVEAEHGASGSDGWNSGKRVPTAALRPSTMLPLAPLRRGDDTVMAMLLSLILVGTFVTSFRNAWREMSDHEHV